MVPLPQSQAAPRQTSLFADRPASRVIPFESIAPGLRPPVPKPRPAAPSARPRQRRVPPKGPPPGQQALDFLPPTPSPAHAIESSPKAAVYCKAPVARPGIRMKAAALDTAVAVGAWAVFLTVFHLLGGTMVWNRTALVIYGLSFALILLFYKVTGCLGGAETPGVQWAGLRLLHFDGRPADKRQRLLRLASGLLSVLPAGIGLFWALGDEEHLAWHDHMSSTFPTPTKS